MAVIKPTLPESSRRSMDDFFKYEEDIVPMGLSGAPRAAKQVGHHDLLLCHCEDKDPNRAQQDDGVTGRDWPVKDTVLRPQQGGPVVTTKPHR